MAVPATPTLRTVISGDNLTGLDTSETFTLNEKFESQYVLKSTDSAVTIDTSYIDTIKTFIFNSTGEYTITITITGGITIPFVVSGLFKFNPSATFRSSITSMTLSTTSVDNITINAYIYGYK